MAAGEDVVDFLFSLLALPVGTAVRLLGTESMVGSAGHLYASIEKLDGTDVLPGADLGALLRPAVSSPAAASNVSLLRLQGTSSVAPPERFFWWRRGSPLALVSSFNDVARPYTR